MKENDKIEKVVINDNGEEKTVEVIYEFHLDSTNKDYIVYTDNESDEDGNVLVAVSSFTEKNDQIILEFIDDENVISEIANLLNELTKEEV